MRLLPGVAAALLLSACGGGDDRGDNGAAADNAASAEPAPVAGAPTPLTPSTPLPAGDGIPGVSAPPPAEAPGPAPSPDLPVQPEAGADAAVTVLRDYFAALSGRRYAEAYRLWNGRGEAAGMSARAFADSFAKYAEYRATIGTPGRIDAGAGQRYINIPVRVTGRLRDGTPVVLEGPVTLHRTGDIDGATAEQRSWRISASALKPRPTGAAAR
ncbi:hypothetical protein ASG37_07125 [Sphingomonas sp. Leaf407]|uniref:hypothetical protein n=1 Tax=unclassified Sphingomonas TaxID=196159 RepID=UPI0006FE2D30|nr:MULTISPECIES: hypothetical protein [unclassified Sphingomonas]KQN39343.1 hypothetical protein ASE97_04415 [Sphingomonas sp. Leaf42]KQT28619.1 hypothetical protein ASG37_07125 [Sphingomonas sp. Leaf407]